MRIKDFSGHTYMSFFVLIATVVGCIIIPQSLLPYFISAFVLFTLFFSPDNDLSFSRPSRNLGVFNYALSPYRWIFKTHRGVSHWPFISTLTKCLYLCMVFVFVWFTASLLTSCSNVQNSDALNIHWLISEVHSHWLILLKVGSKFLISNTQKIWVTFAGACLADLSHIVTDLLSSRRQ